MSSDTQPSPSGPERTVATLTRFVGSDETFDASQEITGRKCLSRFVYYPLEGGPMWYSDRRDPLIGVPSKVLSENLSSLKGERIAHREIVSNQSGHVQYSLPGRGVALSAAVSALLRWDAEPGRAEAR